jgi:single-stranded-DNA-specific exonuclease
MTRLLVRDFDPAAAQRLVADGVLPALARVLAARGIARPDDLQLLIDGLVPPA